MMQYHPQYQVDSTMQQYCAAVSDSSTIHHYQAAAHSLQAWLLVSVALLPATTALGFQVALNPATPAS